ncbi:MAG TPA: hypothetical protein VN736_13400 [Candidatus Limnocylindrales bacterium]|nr:hypothetical protein [Candidatus Limnocylindrales bacterium]
MARAKTPQQKKQDSYAHDRADGAEYPHAERKNRPRFKARTKRQLRRAAKQMLASQPEDVLQLQERPKRKWHKTGVALSEHLIDTQKKRIELEAHNIFRKGYGPATHARFRRVVESWMKGESEHSSALADLYRKLLNPDDEGIQAFFGPEYSWERGYFIRQFFSREPALKRTFDGWLASFRRHSKPRLGYCPIIDYQDIDTADADE